MIESFEPGCSAIFTHSPCRGLAASRAAAAVVARRQVRRCPADAGRAKRIAARACPRHSCASCDRRAGGPFGLPALKGARREQDRGKNDGSSATHRGKPHSEMGADTNLCTRAPVRIWDYLRAGCRYRPCGGQREARHGTQGRRIHDEGEARLDSAGICAPVCKLAGQPIEFCGVGFDVRSPKRSGIYRSTGAAPIRFSGSPS